MKHLLNGQTILLTGASMGIGERLAREFAALGAKLILTARSAEKLDALCRELQNSPAPPTFIPCDFSDATQVEALAEAVLRGGKLDGIVHNAGVGIYGALESTSLAEVRRLFEVNFFSVYQLTRRLLPLLKVGMDPKILLVSSVISWRAIPRMTAYCASKAAINMLGEALRLEVAANGIKVINAYPGRTQTDFTQNAASFGWRPFSTAGHGTSAEQVARKIAKAYRKGKRDEFITLSNRLIVWLNFCWPGLIDWGLKKYFAKFETPKSSSSGPA